MKVLLILLLVQSSYAAEIVSARGYAMRCFRWDPSCFGVPLDADQQAQDEAHRKCQELGYIKAEIKTESEITCITRSSNQEEEMICFDTFICLN